MTIQEAKDKAAINSGFDDFNRAIVQGSRKQINEVVDKAMAIYAHTQVRDKK